MPSDGAARSLPAGRPDCALIASSAFTAKRAAACREFTASLASHVLRFSFAVVPSSEPPASPTDDAGCSLSCLQRTLARSIPAARLQRLSRTRRTIVPEPCTGLGCTRPRLYGKHALSDIHRISTCHFSDVGHIRARSSRRHKLRARSSSSSHTCGFSLELLSSESDVAPWRAAAMQFQVLGIIMKNESGLDPEFETFSEMLHSTYGSCFLSCACANLCDSL